MPDSKHSTQWCPAHLESTEVLMSCCCVMNSITHVFNRDADTVGLYELVDGWGLGVKLGLETENGNRNTTYVL